MPIFTDDKRCTTATIDGFTALAGINNFHLQYFDANGKLLNSVGCHPKDGKDVFFNNGTSLLHRNGYYFADAHTHLVALNPNGSYTSFGTRGNITSFDVGVANQLVIVGCWKVGQVLTFKNGEFQELASFDIQSSNAHLRFVNAHRFIAFGKMHAVVYEITGNEVVAKDRITVASPIIELVPVPHQHYFGLVHKNGVVSMHPL